MLKKVIFFFVVAILMASPLRAHDFWAGLEKAAVGEPALIFLGFGHHFPAADEIKAEVYAERFEPITLIGTKGPIALKAGAQGQDFVSEAPLAAGSYYVLAAGKPGFSSRSPSGYVRKSKADEPSAISCSYGASYGKNLINLDPPSPDSFVTKPVGQKLEIVPQVNPAKVKVGEKFPVKVLFDGKPLAGASLGAYFEGFSEGNEALAFSATTNKDGLVNIIPLRPGAWLAKVSKSDPYSDPKICDRESYSASLAFTIP
ncbi:MAG: DUF4198 domain-containing protein [Deltaproteobacteria bacterium]|jgi:uncharacterized GH25 family protein|nr:DUF4198 domain-containing protein [Deltaproteobacteria bacterium]